MQPYCFPNSSQVSIFNWFSTNWPASFPHTHTYMMNIDDESWNLRNQGWEGCQNLLTQLNQLQYESSSCSTVYPWWGHMRALEAASAIFQQWRPSEALLGSSPSPRELCRTSLRIHMLFPKEVEGALICAWVSLSLLKQESPCPCWNIPGYFHKPILHDFLFPHLPKCSLLNSF